MPFVGLGLHFLIAIYFAVHAVRSGQNLYWLIILFSFPLLGSIVYFTVVFLPDSRLEHGARKAVAAAAKSLDPTRDLREARAAHEYAPTAQTQIRLAAALLDAGETDESVRHYEACLKGPFANDPEIRLGAARAGLAGERFGAALEHLQAIRNNDANFRPETVSLLTAQALAGAGRRHDAQAEFESALAHFGSFESQVEYAIWALAIGDHALAQRLHVGIQRAMARWNRHNHLLNKPLLRRLDAAFELAKQRG